MKQVDIERLRELLMLDEGTGKLYWRVSRGRVKRGAEAGGLHHSGYFRLRIDGVELWSHRVIFALTHGRWPENEVDHEDRNSQANQPTNLRDASRSTNAHNTIRKRQSKSGFRGVTVTDKISKPYLVRFHMRGRRKNLGYFSDPLDAARAYDKAAIEMLGSKAITNQSLELLN